MSRLFILSYSVPFAVAMMTAISAVSGDALSFFSLSTPSVPGSITSSITSSGFFFLTAAASFRSIAEALRLEAG